MAEEEQIAVLEGPHGKAEIIEIWDGGRLVGFEVRSGDKAVKCSNIGEAYIEAGEQAGLEVQGQGRKYA
ncbi:MAG: hypothetical protein OXC99_05635 [Chloroflexi bacterium]|nr:hypothetical protein [Chloroflexota bacterium]